MSKYHIYTEELIKDIILLTVHISDTIHKKDKLLIDEYEIIREKVLQILGIEDTDEK